MKQRVVTLTWGVAWEWYGKEFYKTFKEHWPKEVELRIVTDFPLPIKAVFQIPLQNAPGYEEFMDRWGNDARAQGYGCTHRKAKPGKRYWKKDAVKWAPQAMAPLAGAEGLEDGDIFCWLDADVVTLKDVPPMWLDTLLARCDIACLVRKELPGVEYSRVQHSEIGFWAARIGPKTRRMIQKFSDIYASDDVFKHKEWHSGYIFDRALDSEPKLKINNLNRQGKVGNPWPTTQLAKYLIHKKGKLKWNDRFGSDGSRGSVRRLQSHVIQRSGE